MVVYFLSMSLDLPIECLSVPGDVPLTLAGDAGGDAEPER